MRFADPQWLLVGAVIVTVLAVLLARAERLRTRALGLLGATRRGAIPGASVPSRLRRWLRVAVTTFAVAMGFVALARPQMGLHWETVERTGTDVLLVVDTSRSMDADDVKPTRLERSKLAIRDFVEKFPGNRVGLVTFAGEAFVQSPMTLDHGALLETVDALDTSIVARGGTNIGRAIEVATEALSSEPDNQKAMVLVTDGEDLEGQGLEEAKRAGAAGIIVDTIGVGSPGGELVPQRDERGKAVGIVRDETGKPVRSRLDEPALRAIADAAHGTYHPLGTDGRGLEHLYEGSLQARTRQEASSRTHRVYADWFHVPLGLAVGAVVLDALLGLRWRRGAKGARGARATAAVAAAMLLLGVPTAALASVTGAQKAYAAGRFEEAHAQYDAESAKRPEDARLAFNAGDAAYKAGKFEVAAAAFERALPVADPGLQQHVLYNQGDSLYRIGEAKAADARAEKKEAWTAAVAAYDGALALDPKDADAKFNRDFVMRKLKELEEEEKRKPDPPKPQDQQPQDQQQQQQGQQPKGSQGQNGKGSEDQQGNQNKSENGKQKGGKGSNVENGNGNNESANEEDGREPKAKSPGARLSEEDARALLRALKGEERRAVRRGVDAGAPDTDVAKDW